MKYRLKKVKTLLMSFFLVLPPLVPFPPLALLPLSAEMLLLLVVVLLTLAAAAVTPSGPEQSTIAPAKPWTRWLRALCCK